MAGPQIDPGRLAGVLFGVCFAAASTLAVVNAQTKPRIDAIAAQKAIAARKGVLPAGTAEVDTQEKAFFVDLSRGLGDQGAELTGILSDKQEKSQQVQVYRGYAEDGSVSGYALSCELPDGYSGVIKFMVGVRYDPEVEAFRVAGSTILEHAETPGLGANIDFVTYSEKVAAVEEARPPVPGFLGQFVDRVSETIRLKKEDPPGELDALTAATITSKAYAIAIRRVLGLCNRNTDQFLNPRPPAAKAGEEA
jgi:RnfABCDGE-type electron transport complex G subunit